MGEVFSSWNGDGVFTGRESHNTTHFKPMTTNTNTKPAKTSFVKQAATAVAFAAAPFAIVLSIAAMNTPSAEAYSSTTCYRIGNMVTCSSY